MRDRVNGKNSVLTPQPVTDRLNKVSELHSCAFVSPKGMVDTNQQEFITNLNSTNAELAGFDSLEEPNFTSTKSNAHATIIPISNAQPRGARDHQNTARVPNSASQGRVLPTWTGKAREKFQLHTLNSLLGKKKERLRQRVGNQVFLQNANKLSKVTVVILLKWWKLWISPAKCDELYKLELSWFLAITCIPRTHQVGEKKVTLNNIPHGDQIKVSIFEEILFKALIRKSTH